MTQNDQNLDLRWWIYCTKDAIWQFKDKCRQNMKWPNGPTGNKLNWINLVEILKNLALVWFFPVDSTAVAMAALGGLKLWHCECFIHTTCFKPCWSNKQDTDSQLTDSLSWAGIWEYAAQKGGGPGKISTMLTDSCVIKLSSAKLVLEVFLIILLSIITQRLKSGHRKLETAATVAKSVCVSIHACLSCRVY